MRSRILLLLTAVATLAAPSHASAAFGHVIAPGESLSSVAAADGLSVSQLAAVNGLSADAQLTAGTTLQIPPQTGASGASAVADASTAASAAPGSSSSAGSYVVAPGDTLSTIAARSGVSVDALAAANGLDPAGVLPAGAVIALSGAAAPTSSGAASSWSTAAVNSSTAPQAPAGPGVSSSSGAGAGAQPTPETVSPSQVGSIAAAEGVPPSLAEAIGYQESGFNNGLVSSTGATGVMQIEPGTWSYIGQNLASGPPPLAPSSAQDNVRGGVLLLRSLLDQTGGDPGLAAAGYYQGLDSVRQHGMYADTRRYVNDVMALTQRFGGP